MVHCPCFLFVFIDLRQVSSALLMVSIDSTSTLNDDFMYNISCSGINQLS